MQSFLEKLRQTLFQDKKTFKQLLRFSCVQNNISYSLFSKISHYQTLKHFRQILNSDEFTPKTWIQNELSLFKSIILLHSALQTTQITDFVIIYSYSLQCQTDWLFLSKIFRNKKIYVLQYEAKSLQMAGKIGRRSWGDQEQSLLNQIISEYSVENHWNEVARLLFCKSQGKFFRLGKHCREHWLDHMDPQLKMLEFQHSKSDLDYQDFKVIQFLIKHGKKWKNISKQTKVNLTPKQLKVKYNSIIKKIKAEGIQSTTSACLHRLLSFMKTSPINEGSEGFSQSESFLFERQKFALDRLSVYEEKKFNRQQYQALNFQIQNKSNFKRFRTQSQEPFYKICHNYGSSQTSQLQDSGWEESNSSQNFEKQGIQKFAPYILKACATNL